MSRFTSAQYDAYQARQYARGLAPAPKVSRADELEGEIHNKIIEYLDSIGAYYHHARMDKPTTCREGFPDFFLTHKGVSFAIEVKVSPKKPSIEQLGELAWAKRAGAKTLVAYSVEDVRLFIEAL
jgi:hypothetical protein